MDEKDIDYHIDEDLEQLFHSDLQNLGLGHGDTDHDDVIGDHLPEWLVGVIIVIVMLIVAFFVMIITSLIKNRKKSRSSTYIGTGSHTTCDDLESGKIGHSHEPNMKMTSFTSVPDTLNDSSTNSQSAADTSDRDCMPSPGTDCASGLQGCKNPLFVDDELESNENNSEGKEVKTEIEESKDKKKVIPGTTDVNNPSTSNGIRGTDAAEHGRSKGMPHKYKPSTNSKKSVSSVKTDQHESDTFPDNDGDTRKRIFASKSKCGNQTSNKRERIKGTSANDNIISRSDEPDRTDEVGPENDVQFLTEIPSDSHFHDNDTSACCEDSGVELSSPESQLKEETGGGSESDDIGSSIVARASFDTTLECNYGHDVDGTQSEITSCTDMSPTVSVKNDAAVLINEDDELKNIANVVKGSDARDVVSSPNSSFGCRSKTRKLSDPNILEGKQDVGHTGNEGLSRTAECIHTKMESREYMEDADPASSAKLNLFTTKVSVSSLEEEMDVMSCELFSSYLKSSDEADKTLTVSSKNNTPSTEAVFRATTAEKVTTVESLNAEGSEDVIDSDKLLSTNL